MSGRQLRTILWLRWRLTRNQWAKSGGLGAVLAALRGATGVTLAVLGFAGGLLGGYFGLHGEPPSAVMWTWLALSVAFLFAWALGTVTDLQRSEAIDLQRLMHLPVSLGWAFAVNYLASLMGLTIAVFAPSMIALALGLALDRGPAMLLLVPLSMGLVFMVTAWTYLLQGWIATWVQSPRRRRALLSALALLVVVIVQLPNLLFNVLLRPPSPADEGPGSGAPGFACGAETCRADQACAEPCCGPSPRWKYRYAPDLGFMKRDDLPCPPCADTGEPAGASAPLRLSCVDAKATIRSARWRDAEEKRWERFAGGLRAAEKIVPPLWLAGGAGSLAGGEPLGALLGTLGFAALGALGLLAGYRSTSRFYAGGEGPARAAPARSRGTGASPAKRRLVERGIPGVHDQTAAVAVATLRSLLRAPEVMMGLGLSVLSIPILILVLGTMVRLRVEPGSRFGPLVVAGALALVNQSVAQLQNNQFGYDRDGFRALVLAPIARRRLLLGKNLAAFAVAAPPCAATLAASALWVHLPPLAAAAAVLQTAAMLLVAAMLGNLQSILVPYRIEPGSMRATKLPPVAWLAAFVNLFGSPILYAPAFAGALAVLLGSFQHPALVDLAISLVGAAAAAGAYAASLAPLGRLLQRRESAIVERVTAQNE
jgi:hypothetical protein